MTQEPANLLWFGRKISLVRVAAIAFFFLFLWLNAIALFFPLKTDKKQAACLLFLVMPILVTIAYLPFTTHTDAPQKEGHQGVIALHLLQAAFGLTWHIIALLYLFRDHEIPSRVVQIYTSARTEQWPAYFLLIDLVSLSLSFLYLTAVEDGILVAIVVLVGSVVFGPAFVVSAYCVYREQCISKALSRARNKRKEWTVLNDGHVSSIFQIFQIILGRGPDMFREIQNALRMQIFSCLTFVAVFWVSFIFDHCLSVENRTDKVASPELVSWQLLLLLPVKLQWSICDDLSDRHVLCVKFFSPQKRGGHVVDMLAHEVWMQKQWFWQKLVLNCALSPSP